MSNFHADAEKKMNEWKTKAESNDKKVQDMMNAAGREINSSRREKDELKKKVIESQIKNGRIAAENQQNAKNAQYLHEQLLNSRSTESTIVSEAIRLVGLVKCNPNNSLDQSKSKDTGGQ